MDEVELRAVYINDEQGLFSVFRFTFTPPVKSRIAGAWLRGGCHVDLIRNPAILPDVTSMLDPANLMAGAGGDGSHALADRSLAVYLREEWELCGVWSGSDSPEAMCHGRFARRGNALELLSRT
jgi:hypothetical protein